MSGAASSCTHLPDYLAAPDVALERQQPPITAPRDSSQRRFLVLSLGGTAHLIVLRSNQGGARALRLGSGDER